jgi:spore coat polysaccharide biosynthesis predicted glycosyltransferase SpsG
MKNVVNIYLRSKGGLFHGWGHVIRSLTVARYLKKSDKSIKIFMAVEGGTVIKEFMDKQDIKCFVFDEHSSIFREREEIRDFSPNIIIVDMLDVPEYLLTLYEESSDKLVIFNDLGRNYNNGDILICPQILSAYPQRKNNQKQLNGTDYFVISEGIEKNRYRPEGIPVNAKSLLIIMGGCIQQVVFKKLIEVVEKLRNLNLEIYFSLGFDNDVDMNCYRQLESHGVYFIKGTDNIGEFMTKADVAISSSGYVKYELAATGTPSILVSVVEHQDELAKAFVEKSNCAEYLGNIIELEVAAIANSVINLIKDKERRRDMAKAGQGLIDGNALERIKQEILVEA